MDKRTAIVIGADHFPYGLDDDGPLGSLPYTSELYGYDVQTYFQRDHNRLIIWSASLEDKKPITVDTPVSAIDILPTLLNLFGCEWDSRLLPGRDVFSDKPALVFNLSYDWKSELGTYYAGAQEFVPNDGAKIPKGYVEKTSADVANRINYCRGVLTTDYYRHVFGD
jgi:lipoteichoic acid synthase